MSKMLVNSVYSFTQCVFLTDCLLCARYFQDIAVNKTDIKHNKLKIKIYQFYCMLEGKSARKIEHGKYDY